jgi:hypothetical protein
MIVSAKAAPAITTLPIISDLPSDGSRENGVVLLFEA